jgi:hypothetical protein
MLEKRKGVLERLEVAETRFIRSFKANLPRPSTQVDEMQVEKEGGIIASPIATGNLSRNLSVVSNTTEHPFRTLTEGISWTELEPWQKAFQRCEQVE